MSGLRGYKYMVSAKKSLISRYRHAVDRKIKLVNMNPSELAGYYLLRFPGDPISAVTDDMLDSVK